MEHKKASLYSGVILNAYPDSIGGTLSDLVDFLMRPELNHVFSSLYILPSIFNTDLDRGFSVIDYGINEQLADRKDLEQLKALGINLKLDFILNHASVLSKPFQDIMTNGSDSVYRDYFIDWNKFWEGHGRLTEEGYIQPDEELVKNMFFRKPELPILMVRFPDGKEVPYWNTFYQEVNYPKAEPWDLMKKMDIRDSTAVQLCSMVNCALEEGKKPGEIEFGKFEPYKDAVITFLESHRRYLGQMDLNIKSPLVWEHYDQTLRTLAEYGAEIVRLDAFAYAHKEPGAKNFLNEPGTWELLEQVQKLADRYDLELLPEIHASYEEKIYELLAQKGYMVYDFFLPGLLIDALECGNGETLARWAEELYDKKIRSINMLGCHDGIPLLDLKGLIPDEQIEKLIQTVVQRGGYVKNLHGQQKIYYQVNATYYSALGEDDARMLLARAIQLFMPGKPQVWYLDLFAGKNDYEAVEKAGVGGHKEINRSNLSMGEVEIAMGGHAVRKQLEMLRFRNQCSAFGFDAVMEVKAKKENLEIVWKNHGCAARLKANLKTCQYEIAGDGDLDGFLG